MEKISDREQEDRFNQALRMAEREISDSRNFNKEK